MKTLRQLDVGIWGINHKIINTCNQILKLEYLGYNFIFFNLT